MSEGIDIHIDIDSIPELTLVPDNAYQVQCTRCESAVAKESGRPMLVLTLEIVDEPLAQNIIERISLPMEGDDTKKKSQIVHGGRGIATLLRAFDLPSKFNTNDFVGKLAWADVATEPETDQYPAKNRVTKWIVPA